MDKYVITEKFYLIKYFDYIEEEAKKKLIKHLLCSMQNECYSKRMYEMKKKKKRKWFILYST